MNSWEKERAEQEAADQIEEERVAREDRVWEGREIQKGSRLPHSSIPGCVACQPYLFADEGSQRRAEEEESFYGPIDDYAAFLDQAPPYEQLIR